MTFFRMLLLLLSLGLCTYDWQCVSLSLRIEYRYTV